MSEHWYDEAVIYCVDVDLFADSNADGVGDLNVANPNVRDEIQSIMGFWLQLGVSGFRIDAAPFIIELTAVAPHRRAARGGHRAIRSR